MSRTLSSALGAIEQTDRQAAIKEYGDILRAGVSADQAERDRATKPEAVLRLRSIMATLGKTREDVARDEAIVARFHQDKDAARRYQEAEAAREKAELAADAAHDQYAREVSEAAAKRDEVLSARDEAINACTSATAAQGRCKKMLAENAELFSPEDREYPLLVETGTDGKHRILYQRAKTATPANSPVAVK